MTAISYILVMLGTLAVSFIVFFALLPFGLLIGRITFTEIIDRINWGI
jgi:hypothetical protein